MGNIILLIAIPYFLISILVEWLVDHRRKSSYFDFVDSFGSLSLGIWNLTSRLIIVGGGALVYREVLNGWTLFDLSDWSWGIAIIAFVVYDFSYYWNHRISHERNFFWASHAIHHQSEEYNLTTALRQTSSGWFGFIFYIPMYVIGFEPELIGAVAALNLVYQFGVHTRHIGKLGVIDRIMVTPSNHRVHHGQNKRYIDKNHGGVFILWDRLFGTFQEELDEDPVVYGVTRPLHHPSPLKANLQVWASLFSDAWHAKRLKDKFGIWFARTGWRPDDCIENYPITKTDLENFSPYRPKVSRASIWYAAYQLVLAIVMATLFFAAGGDLPYATRLLVWALIAFPLVTAAGLMMSERRALGYEVLRVAITFTAALQLSSPWQSALIFSAMTSAMLFLSTLALTKKAGN